MHGLGGSSRWWREVALRDRDVCAVDYRRAEALVLAEPSIVVGHSLGGLLAAQLAAAHPADVRALVLVAPVGMPRPLLRYAGGLAAVFRASPWLLVPAAVDALRWGVPALAHGVRTATRTAFAGAITAPTLLVWGARDRLVPPAFAASWQRAIPEARLELITGAGHVPMLEAPGAFNEVVERFLDDVGV